MKQAKSGAGWDRLVEEVIQTIEGQQTLRFSGLFENFISLGTFRTGDTMIVEDALRYRKQYIQCDECFTVIRHSITKEFYDLAKAQEDVPLPLDEL